MRREILGGLLLLGWSASVSWCAIIRQSSNSESVEARLRNITDDGTVGGLVRLEPKDSGNREDGGSAFDVIFTGAAKTSELQYRAQDGGGTAKIRDARIEIWRVS